MCVGGNGNRHIETKAEKEKEREGGREGETDRQTGGQTNRMRLRQTKTA